jgi:hypothetical protein
VNLQSPIPRLALRPSEAAAAIGCSPDFFAEHIDSELRWCRRGRVRVVSVTELQRWLDEHAERVLEDRRAA